MNDNINIKSFIPNDVQVSNLESYINETLIKESSIKEYMYIVSIDEFYWDDKVSWFVFMKNEDGLILSSIKANEGKEFKHDISKYKSRYTEVTLQPDSNATYLTGYDIKFSNHGFPCISERLWEMNFSL